MKFVTYDFQIYEPLFIYHQNVRVSWMVICDEESISILLNGLVLLICSCLRLNSKLRKNHLLQPSPIILSLP